MIYFPQCATNFICVPQVPQSDPGRAHRSFNKKLHRLPAPSVPEEVLSIYSHEALEEKAFEHIYKEKEC